MSEAEFIAYDTADTQVYLRKDIILYRIQYCGYLLFPVW